MNNSIQRENGSIDKVDISSASIDIRLPSRVIEIIDDAKRDKWSIFIQYNHQSLEEKGSLDLSAL